MDISLEYFKIFYYVGKTGSITAAAKELMISQPAVSQAMKHFEEELGAKVFLRSSKGVKLTKEGEALFLNVEKGYNQILTGVHQFEALKNLEDGEICIGASDMTLRFYILPYLEKFHEKYPRVKLTVSNAPTPRTIDNIRTGALDFGVISSPVQDKEGLEICPVREIEDIFIVGEKYKDLSKDILDYHILEQYPYICLAGKTSSNDFVNSFLAKQGIELKPEIQLATSDMLVSFVERGFGVASVMKDFAMEGLKNHRLYELKFDNSLPKREICIAYEENKLRSNAATLLLEFLTQSE